MYGLAKIAASFDAQRNKQYWQMLKRMYGGSDEAIQGIKESGDDGIWHGTRAKFLSEIEEQGLTPGQESNDMTFGVGQHFAPKNIAEYYGSDLIRFAKPSELSGTKELYPNVNQAIVADLDSSGVLKHVARHNLLENMEKVKPLLPKGILKGVTDGDEALEIYEKEIGKVIKQQYYKNKYYGKNDDLGYIYTDNRGPKQIHYKDTEVIPPHLLRFEKKVEELPAEKVEELLVEEATEPTTGKSMWPYIGLGAAGIGATGGLAYLAHKKNKEKKQEEAN